MEWKLPCETYVRLMIGWSVSQFVIISERHGSNTSIGVLFLERKISYKPISELIRSSMLNAPSLQIDERKAGVEGGGGAALSP